MSTIKYVEAMIAVPDGWRAAPLPATRWEPDTKEMRSCIKDARSLIARDPSESTIQQWANMADLLIEEAEALLEDIREHECECDHDEPDDPVPLVSVGDPSSLQAQFDRLGFLRAEEVAIVRLSDLRKLMERAG